MDLLSLIKKYKYGICTGIVAGILTVILPKEVISTIIIIIIGVIIGVSLILLNKEQKDRHFLITIFVSAFLLRIFISPLVYSVNLLLKGAGLIGDGWCYSENGYLLLNMWLSGVRDIRQILGNMYLVSTSGTLSNYDFWNAFVYFFTGKSPLSLIYINCLASSLTVIPIYYITKQLSNQKAAIIASCLTGFWPSLIFWSTQNLKEPISILLIAVLIWFVVRIKEQFKFSPSLIFLILLTSLFLYIFSKDMAVFVFFVICLYFLIICFPWKRIQIKPIFFIFFLFLFIFLFINRKGMFFLRHLYTMRTYKTWDAQSAFLANLDFTKPLGFVIFIPLAFLYSWFAPFPWHLGSLSQMMASYEMLIFYLLALFIPSGIKFLMEKNLKDSAIIMVYVVVMFFILAILEGNIGTLFRHRAVILPFVFVLIGIGIDQKHIIPYHHDG